LIRIELMEEKIREILKNSVGRLFPQIKIPEIQVEHPEKKEFGDYSTNLAFLVAKELKKKPSEIANQIAKSVEKEKIFERVEVKEPGFINFFLSLDFLFEELRKILKEKENFGKSKIGKGKTVIIDYSSPNIAKPFGIGHLRSTIIGQALYNIYKFLGYKVIGDNHLGDWGTQFGKLIFAIKKWGKKKVEDYSIEELEELYVKFHKEAEKNPQLEEEGRKWFKKLEEGDKGAKRIWKILVKISLKEFERIYKLLEVKFDFSLGESFYEPMTKEVIEELKERKIAKESQGALIIEFPKNEFPLVILQKSDGTTTYFTRDLATIKYRLKRWNPDLIIYEVGADQQLHFQQLFKTVEILGWAKKTKFVHVAHGLYRTKTGKFSTRRGETVHLEDVLKEAIERAKEIIEKSETSRGLTEREKEKISKIVGIGAVKYNDLSQHPSKDIIFDWEKVLNLKGNSAPYLQYTFVRCQSVLRKAKKLQIENFKLQIEKLKKEEIDILREIYKFPEIVEEAAEKFSPNLICNFIFDLAKKYNLFYDLYPILKAEDEEIKNFRLILTKSVAQIIKNSLSLLGIQTPEKM
jgi:arginyl-tRNA synthetase